MTFRRRSSSLVSSDKNATGSTVAGSDASSSRKASRNTLHTHSLSSIGANWITDGVTYSHSSVGSTLMRRT